MTVARIHLPNAGQWEPYVEVDKKVELKKAAEKLGQVKMDEIFKRSRLRAVEDKYAACAKCGLSWDNKKGCVGNFGPAGSPVPELSKKYGLSLLAKVNEA